MAGPAAEQEIARRLAALSAATASRDPLSRLAVAVGEAAMWLFLAAVGLSIYEVVARYAFNAPTTWIHATTTTMCAVAFALGGAYCMARREHISVTYLSDRASRRGKRLIAIVSLMVGTFYLAAFAWGVFADARLSIWRFDFQGAWNPEATPGPPNWPLPSIGKAALLLGALLFLLVTLAQLVRTLGGRDS